MMRATFVSGWAHDARSLEPLSLLLADLLSVTLCGFDEAEKAASLEADVILGWSMGGLIAQELAAKRAVKLVLISSTPRFCSAPDFSCGTPERELRALASGIRKDAEKMVEGFMVYAAEPHTPLHRAPPCDPAMLATGLKYLQHTDLRHLRITCPTLILHGRQDRVIPWQASQWLADHIPGARLDLLDGVGHDLPIRCCKEIANAVRKWIA